MPPNLQNRSTRNNSDVLNPASKTPISNPSRPRRSRRTSKRRGRRRSSPWVQSPERPPQNQPGVAKDNPADDNAWSDAVESVLEQPPSRLPQMLMLGGLLFVVSLGIWSWIGKFDQIGYASGKLIPQGELFKVHSAEAGKIVSLNVREGERLEKDELIAVLDNDLAKGDNKILNEEHFPALGGGKTSSTKKNRTVEDPKKNGAPRPAYSDALKSTYMGAENDTRSTIEEKKDDDDAW